VSALLTKALRTRLLANGRRSASEPGFDTFPVVKLFMPDGQATWLLSELDDDDIAFGLCDLGLGFPELGAVSLGELANLRGRLGLPVERDRYFEATAPLSVYAQQAQQLGMIDVPDDHYIISYDTFISGYLPVNNHLDENAAFDGFMFETYGKELQHVCAQNRSSVWTLMDGDCGLWIGSGFHHVNRLGYFITKQPVNDRISYEVPVDDDNQEGEQS